MLGPIRERLTRLLKWSERHLRTDVSYLVSSGSWLLSGQFVALVAGFALAIVFGNLVPKDVYGNYKFVFSLAGLLTAFTLTTMGNAVTQAVARGFEGALARGFRDYLLWSIPSVIATFGLAAYYLWNGNGAIGYSLLVVAVFSPLLIAFNLYSAYLKGKRDFRTSTIYGFFSSTLPPFVLIALVLLGFRSYVPLFFICYYVTTVGLSAYFHYRTLAAYKPHGATDPQTTRYAIHLSLMSLPGRATTYVDKILVFHFLGAVPLAVYSFATAPSLYAMRFNGILGTLALPKLAATDIPTIKKTLPRKVLFHAVAAIIVTITYIVLAPYFFALLLPKYMAAVPYSQVLGLTILTAPGTLLGQTLIAHMRKWELYFLNTVTPIIELSLYAALIPIWGLWGIVWATVITGFAGTLLSAWIFFRLKVSGSETPPIAR